MAARPSTRGIDDPGLTYPYVIRPANRSFDLSMHLCRASLGRGRTTPVPLLAPSTRGDKTIGLSAVLSGVSIYWPLSAALVQAVARESRKNPMRVTHYLPLLAFVATLVPAAAAWSQAVTPQAQILQPIDESKRISLKGNTLPVANNENDRGQVSPRLPMTD